MERAVGKSANAKRTPIVIQLAANVSVNPATLAMTAKLVGSMSSMNVDRTKFENFCLLQVACKDVLAPNVRNYANVQMERYVTRRLVHASARLVL